MSVESALITIDQLSKSFLLRGSLFKKVKRLQALDKVSLQIKKGETIGIVGESGSGKSTLARQIMMLDNPDSGTIHLLLDNEKILLEKIPKKILYRKLQMVFQDPYSSLNPRKKIWQIICSPLSNLQKITRQQQREIAKKYMNLVGLEASFVDVYPHQLSGGQRQRVGIARALVTKPEILILDEPLSALDLSIQAQMINLLLELQDQLDLTYIFISHDLAIVQHLTDNVAVMYAGRIVEYGRTKDVINNPLHPYSKGLIDSSINFKTELPDTLIKDEQYILTKSDNGCSFAPRCTFAVNDCHKKKPMPEKNSGRTILCHLA